MLGLFYDESTMRLLPQNSVEWYVSPVKIDVEGNWDDWKIVTINGQAAVTHLQFEEVLKSEREGDERNGFSLLKTFRSNAKRTIVVGFKKCPKRRVTSVDQPVRRGSKLSPLSPSFRSIKELRKLKSMAQVTPSSDTSLKQPEQKLVWSDVQFTLLTQHFTQTKCYVTGCY